MEFLWNILLISILDNLETGMKNRPNDQTDIPLNNLEGSKNSDLDVQKMLTILDAIDPYDSNVSDYSMVETLN